MDLAETIHRAIYRKSGYLNANKNKEFIEGFLVGNLYPTDLPAYDAIMDEADARSNPKSRTKEWEDFMEWRRGFMAARMQKAFACRQIREI